VRVIDGGTSPDVSQLLGDVGKLIIVDAVRGGGMPGAIYRFHLDEIALEQKPFLSVHEIGLVENLSLVRLWHGVGEIVIIGVEPKEIGWGLELSPELQQRVPQIVEAVLAELNNGHKS
jgi:hydrogenase maturation protease